ncbi:hypothetical protein ACF3NA_08995 [Alkanindiges sp. WGS2144]|uniref:hypothetical protein n=1 Tax=Alkanindiges sp. WGS2144 TaxID=3366808 RepID=UPI0037528C5F
MKPQPIALSITLLFTTLTLNACNKVGTEAKENIPETLQAQNSQPRNDKISPVKSVNTIENLIDGKIKDSISFLNEESRRASPDDDYFKYTLNSKNIIKSDLNHDGKPDYIVEASFCEETSCHSTTMTSEFYVFIISQNDQPQFITSINFDLNAKIIDITKDGIITIENHEYADDDPSCCPSIINKQTYALVGKKLAVLAD